MIVADHHYPGGVNLVEAPESQIVYIGKWLSEELSIQPDFAAEFMGVLTGLQTEMVFARRNNIGGAYHDWARNLGQTRAQKR
jgi:hypothetical protein